MGGPPAGEAVGELLWVIAALREHCPWMGALTHASLVEYLIEEAYEVVESIEGGSEEELRGELGDVLLQVVLHARLAEEHDRFDFGDVARGITGKMIRRNPHVFRPDGTLQDSFPATVDEIERKWDSIKSTERKNTESKNTESKNTESKNSGRPGRATALDGIPEQLPALARARKSIDRAARAGLPVPTGAAPGLDPESGPATEEALGRLLLAVVVTAHGRGLDAERALRGAVRQYHEELRNPS